MRKFLISLLLAGAAATPAIAGSNNWSDQQQTNDSRQQARADRQAAREDRQAAREQRSQARDESRAARQGNSNGGNFNGGQFNGYARPERVNVPQQPVNGGGGAERFNGRPERGNFGGRFEGQGNYVAPGPRVVTPGSRFDGREGRVNERDFRQSNRRGGPPVVSNVPRPGTQPPLRYEGNRGGDVRWDRDWRRDNHYDWRRYRDHHRSLFRLGFYVDPFGWGYQPFSIGWRMWPDYYGNQYWIDPGMYELPYPPPGAVWVRYWNDALLVDTYSGTVIDVIPGFFW